MSKARLAGMHLQPQLWEWLGRQWIPRAHWPTRLAKLMSSKYNVTDTLFQKVRQRVVEEDT